MTSWVYGKRDMLIGLPSVHPPGPHLIHYRSRCVGDHAWVWTRARECPLGISTAPLRGATPCQSALNRICQIVPPEVWSPSAVRFEINDGYELWRSFTSAWKIKSFIRRLFYSNNANKPHQGLVVTSRNFPDLPLRSIEDPPANGLDS